MVRSLSPDSPVTWVAPETNHPSLLSVPLRYMHTPNELLSLRDLEDTARLLAAFCARLRPGQDFTP